MTWNWQKPDWPDFRWNEALLRKAEERFLLEAGMFVGTVKHLLPADLEQLVVEAMSVEAVTTSEIEGETLDRAIVQSSIRKQLGFAADNVRVKPAEQGMAEMMVDLYRSFSAPLSNEMLFAWHRMLTNGRRDLRYIGAYREDAEPMQVVSGALYSARVHFEAPPSSRVPKEMARFVNWFNRTGPGGGAQVPTLTRAGIAHLYFESIHPFEDGNGRIGRLISEKALAQSLGQPTLTVLAAAILTRRKEYYAALEEANKKNEITRWLLWFAGVAIEAQRRTAATIEFLIDKTRLLDKLRGQLNQRQEKALLRTLREGPEGFKGGLSAGNYERITGASPATTTRDLADMVAKGALTRSGERRHARYALSIRLRPVPAVTVNEQGEIASAASEQHRDQDILAT
jgi:Fic family protein